MIIEVDTFPPACQCGCGDPVRLTAHGYTKYVNLAHFNWCKPVNTHSARAAKAKDNIPIEDFRAAIRKLKAQKQVTYRELAMLGGEQPGWLNTYMYDKRCQSIGREAATGFLRRLAGIPSAPSRYQERTAPKHVKRVDQTIAQMGVDGKRKLDQKQRYLRWG